MYRQVKHYRKKMGQKIALEVLRHQAEKWWLVLNWKLLALVVLVCLFVLFFFN